MIITARNGPVKAIWPIKADCREAKEAALPGDRPPIYGETLTHLTFEHGVGVREYPRYDVRRVEGAYLERDV